MIKQKLTKVITGNYETSDADIGYRIICNSASPIEITLHTATGRYYFELEIDNIGAGTVTCSTQEIEQYQHAHVGNTGTAWTVVIGGVGDIGYTGSVGVGYTGSQGETGYTGSIGETGLTGSVGTGYNGSQGEIGYTGSQGDPGGYTGSQGGIGYTGSQGEIGYTGSIGAGYDGSIGETGYTGSVGLTGSAGDSGFSILEQLDNYMGEPIGYSGSIAYGEYMTVQPGSGETWCITYIEKDGGEMDLYLTDNSTTIKFSDNSYNDNDPDTQIIKGPIYIDNTTYLKIHDASYNSQTFTWRGFMVDDGATEITEVVAGFTNPAGVTTIRPAEGEEWMITVLGYNISGVVLTDGIDSYPIQNQFFDNKLKIRLTHDWYISSPTNATCYSGFVLVPEP